MFQTQYSIPNREKYNSHLRYYNDTGKIKKDIVVNLDNILLDGYIDLLILGAQKVKIYPCVVRHERVKHMGFSEKMRKIVWQKSRGKCACCGMDLKITGSVNDLDYMTIDHIYPKSLGGSDNLINLQAMCKKCNRKKGATFSLR